MATRPKAVIESRNGEKFSPITIAKNVLTDDGQNLHDILSDRKEDMMTPTIENSSSMFKVGQGDNVDYSSNVVNGAYESMILKGKTMVNCIQEPSSQDVVLPYEFEDGQYVTINDTKESGALGVELKGQTLVNLVGENKVYTLNADGTYKLIHINLNTTLETNKKYYLSYRVITNTIAEGNFGLFVTNGSDHCGVHAQAKRNETGTMTYVGDVNKVADKLRVFAEPNCVSGTFEITDVILIEYQKGMENLDIPYFEGMTSCKMPTLHTVGKNLFDGELELGAIDSNTTGENVVNNSWKRTVNYLKVEPNTKYVYSLSLSGAVLGIRFYDENKKFIRDGGTKPNFTTPTNCHYIRFNVTTTEEVNIQIEKGSTATSYEPYKSSILSTPSDLILRGIGNVKDELNVATGELTQRIGEVVLDGGENWVYESTYTTESVYGCYIGLHLISQPPKPNNFNFANNVFPNITNSSYQSEGFATNPGVLSLRIAKDKLESADLSGFKKYLQNNPVTLQYPLATESIKTVDLEAVDQEGNVIPTLKSWNTTTHIYSEIPENTLYPTLSHSNPSYPVIIKPSTKYSIVANSYSNGHTNSAINFNLGGATASTTVGNRVTTITTPSTLSNELLTMSGRGNKLNNVMVIEGDVVGDEPYFEGICDCKSPILSNVGENLFATNNMRTGNIAGNSSVVEGNDISGNWQVTDYIPVKPLIEYYHSTSLYKFEKASFYDINKKIIYGTGVNNFKTMVISTPHQCAYVRYVVMKDSSTNNSLSLEELVSNNDIVVAQGSSNIAYEPYQSNILSCETYFDEATQSDKTIVLRSLPNGVCDTLNVETGEYVQRIGEVVFDGSSDEVMWFNTGWTNGECVACYWNVNAMGLPNKKPNVSNMVCDSFPTATSSIVNTGGNVTREGIWGEVGSSVMYISIKKTKLTEFNVTGFRQWASQNPITVQYELETSIVSTVDIQGFPYAYTNGHVQLSSGHSGQSLTPKVEYSVITNRNGQIRSNQKMVERHQKQLDRLQAMILTNLVNTQYEQTLTNLKYDLKNVREEVK